MDRLFYRVLSREWIRPFAWEAPPAGEFVESLEMRPPRVDVIDGEENILIRAEVPKTRSPGLPVGLKY